jgi:general secretion pathway protein A
MYKDYFRLNEMPFSIAPDPSFLFMSDRHREAMAHLLYGVQGEGGIVLLTGEIGTGKTTICRSLIEQIPDNIDVAFILNPRMSVEELLQTICEEFHIDIAAGKHGIKTYVDTLNARLLAAHAQGRRAILIVDEAQNLDLSVLEQLRLLTNLETNTRKLLQIFLIGQPELQNMLARPEMCQVAQRVVARYHLGNLNQQEVSTYIAHRLRVSGASPLIFPEVLAKQVYRASNGVPRLINLICDRALLGTYVQGQQQVTAPTLRQSVLEVFAVTSRKPKRPWGMVAALLAVVAGVSVLFATQMNNANTRPNKLELKIASAVPASSAAASVAQAASAPPAIAQPITTLEWPSNAPFANSETLAFQSLFKLYGISLRAESIETPCQQAAAKGLRCYAGQGGLSDLLSINQPVLMRLLSADGKAYSAALTALDHQVATLVVGGVVLRVSLSDLANAWLGQFVVIWNAPPGFMSELRLNQRGATVAWMRHAMEAVDGVRDNGSDVFDAELERRVRTFQLTEGMQPDGLVGSRTLIRLNVRSSRGDLPHLTAEKGG